MVDSSSRRRFFAPEVIQTSAMDCGPAALKCLVEGFGRSISYGRLREACQTSVDGTSIDSLEELARAVGLDAQQVMLPLDHVLQPESGALPAIAIVHLPGGNRHFVVIWRVHGAWVQVMDPLRGRRWIRRQELLNDLFVHTMNIPAEMFRDWAGSDEFRMALGRRMSLLGLGDRGAALAEVSLTDPTWRTVARLDAVIRLVGALVEAGALARGAEAQRLVDALVAGGAAPTAEMVALQARYATASDAPPADDGTPQVSLRGAVLVTVAGIEELGEAHLAELPKELRAALDQPNDQPAAVLLGMLREDGSLYWAALLGAVLVAAVGAIVETVLFRGLFDVIAGHASRLVTTLLAPLAPGLGLSAGSRGTSTVLLAVVTIFILGLLGLEWPLALALRGSGRRLERRMRGAFLRKIPLLGDRFFQSRPVSDMAERAHVTHSLKAVPLLGSQLVRAVAELLSTTVALCWLYPGGAVLAVALAASMLSLPWLAQSTLTERDLRMRNHAGALARFYLDALLGLTAIRTHGAEDAVVREHADRLSHWRDGAGAMLRASLSAEALQSIVGFGLAAWLLARFVDSGAVAVGESGAILLVVYWSLGLPTLGGEIAFLARQYPAQRNMTLRLTEPLGALDDEPASEERAGSTTETFPTSESAASGGSFVRMSRVEVQAGGHVILTVNKLELEASEHIAVVGPSGAGKSSLAGLLLGWHRPSTGGVLVDGEILAGRHLAELRSRTVWIDPSVYLWNRTLHENVAFGLAAAPPSLEVALREAELEQILLRLSAAKDGRLGEAGALVSGGEGQRVRFARGLTRSDPRLVILDEPFRGLTREQRRRLLDRARSRWAAATILCVTHDIAETRDFARVLVVEGGRIVEDGAPLALANDPASRYTAFLEADARVKRRVWSSTGQAAWRRLRLEGGRLSEASEVDP